MFLKKIKIKPCYKFNCSLLVWTKTCLSWQLVFSFDWLFNMVARAQTCCHTAWAPGSGRLQNEWDGLKRHRHHFESRCRNVMKWHSGYGFGHTTANNTCIEIQRSKHIQISTHLNDKYLNNPVCTCILVAKIKVMTHTNVLSNWWRVTVWVHTCHSNTKAWSTLFHIWPWHMLLYVYV